ncbi:MAG TPA: cytochrome d ubiquinol oxidase subunit II [Terriglobales bacterium]|nr:cytochrome d ubiquinol oxidase subunit II [Terriglobales bacterium]
MTTVWFVLVAFMIIAYVVLDGFDLGVGILHLIVARTEEERRLVLHSIGPVWDGNEVWLLAGGGTIYFAFPLLYASAFSGFYLPLMIVLWLLIARAIGIEFRAHLQAPVWRSFFDGLFAISSALLAIFFGAALGNVVRGVPLNADHLFFEALWTDWRVGTHPGILDWYTVLSALVALVALTQHGALYLCLKNSGRIADYSRKTALWCSPLMILLTVASLIATVVIRPELTLNYSAHPVWFIIPILVAAALVVIPMAASRNSTWAAFLASAIYLVAMLAGAAVALYPNVLPATTSPANSLTISNAATGAHVLRVGLYWWIPGIAIAIGYFVLVYRTFAGYETMSGAGH